MLPLLGVLLFALMGIAALVVDAGVAFSTQAELEATGRTLALENARFTARNPSLGEEAWEQRRRRIERDLSALEGRRPRWEPDRDRTDHRVYSRVVTPRFAFAAMLPTTLGPDGQVRDGLSVRDLLQARASNGPDTLAPSGGLRGRGFRPQVSLPVSARRPAARVGPRIPGLPAAGGGSAPPRRPGLAGIALTQSAFASAIGETLSLGADGRLTAASGDCVGWAIDSSRGASLGRPVSLDPGAADWQLDPRQGYVPVVEGDCTTPENRIVAFLNLRRPAGSDRLIASDQQTAANASATPAPDGQPFDPDVPLRCGSSELLCVPSLVAEAPGP